MAKALTLANRGVHKLRLRNPNNFDSKKENVLEWVRRGGIERLRSRGSVAAPLGPVINPGGSETVPPQPPQSDPAAKLGGDL